MSEKRSSKTMIVVLTGMFAAVLAVLSQLSIPMPSGVPVTLQTFAVALTAYVLGWKVGTLATVVYVLIGAVGVPVFANLHGGVGVLVGATGGFIWGFILMVLLLGFALEAKNKVLLVVLSAAGLAVCHLLGILQFMAVMNANGKGMSFAAAAMLVSVPYLLKDIISVAAAYFLAMAVRRGLRAANLQVAV
ncbi:MAG: biotin transporter BioY [Eubacteriales bacterium]|nr:biotin transporter BioY [Eubacteriales bacterium]